MTLVTINPATESTRLTELRSIPTAPKPDNVRAILAKLAVVREIGIPTGITTAIHPDRLFRLAREGRLSPTYLIERYTTSRRRATTVALLIDLEARLIDAALGMADQSFDQFFSLAVMADRSTVNSGGEATDSVDVANKALTPVLCDRPALINS